MPHSEQTYSAGLLRVLIGNAQALVLFAQSAFLLVPGGCLSGNGLLRLVGYKFM
jgi:hypothetical protein